VTTTDLSCNGVAVTGPRAREVPVGKEAAIWLEQTGWIPCRIVRRDGDLLGIALHLDMPTRHQLIRMLFSEPAHNIAYRGRPRMAIARLMRRALSG
jgi:cellulose synthase (UDP-forming)